MLYIKASAQSVQFVVYLLRTWLYNISTTNWACFMSIAVHCVLIAGSYGSVYDNLLSTGARCVVIILGMQRHMVDFVWVSVARSIGVSRYTCLCLYLLFFANFSAFMAHSVFRFFKMATAAILNCGNREVLLANRVHWPRSITAPNFVKIDQSFMELLWFYCFFFQDGGYKSLNAFNAE